MPHPRDTTTSLRSHTRYSDIVIENRYVSRRHFEIYSVLYDDDDGVPEAQQNRTLYVRDYQSLEGTFVNGQRIGSKSQGHTPAYLLSPGDTISIEPYWEFRIVSHGVSLKRSPFTQLQMNEMHLFRDRYIIHDRCLGDGSVGSIYLALDVRKNRQVACKIHNIGKLRNQRSGHEIVKRINDETDILGKLRHPNIVKFEYGYRSRHTLYTFIELATGGDLFSTVLFYTERFPYSIAQLIVYQIVRATRHMHRQRLIHRDLKPENILFADGPRGTGRVIVADLGFTTGTNWGRCLSTVGTEAYIAPEMYHGNSHSAAVDMWSIGVITFFLLVPELRHQLHQLKRFTQEEMEQRLGAVFKCLEEENCPLSPQIQDFMRRCLSVDPERRITASQAKNHTWFNKIEAQRPYKLVRQQAIHLCKMTSRITPPIEELPDVTDSSNLQWQSSRPLVDTQPLEKSEADDGYSQLSEGLVQASPFFRNEGGGKAAVE